MNLRRSLILASLPLILCQCDDGGASTKLKGLRDEIDQLSHQNYETQQQVDRLQSQIKAARTEKTKLEEEKTKVEADREAATKQLDQLQRDFETYKSKYKLSMKQRAPGLHVANFTSADGKVYQNVVLRDITETHVNFTHEAGIMKLHYKQLPETLQDMLGYLIELKSPASRNVSALSPKQFNADLKSDRESRETEVKTLISSLREKKDTLVRSLNKVRLDRKSAQIDGHTTTVIKLDEQLSKYELAVNQLDAEIMRVQVDLHKVQNETLKLLPVR